MIRGRQGRGPAVRDLRPRGSSAWPVQGDPAATPGDEPCHGSALRGALPGADLRRSEPRDAEGQEQETKQTREGGAVSALEILALAILFGIAMDLMFSRRKS